MFGNSWKVITLGNSSHTYLIKGLQLGLINMTPTIRDIVSTRAHIGVKRLAKLTGMKRSTVVWHLHDGDYEKVEPFETGSMKTQVNVWKTQSHSP